MCTRGFGIDLICLCTIIVSYARALTCEVQLWRCKSPLTLFMAAVNAPEENTGEGKISYRSSSCRLPLIDHRNTLGRVTCTSQTRRTSPFHKTCPGEPCNSQPSLHRASNQHHAGSISLPSLEGACSAHSTSKLIMIHYSCHRRILSLPSLLSHPLAIRLHRIQQDKPEDPIIRIPGPVMAATHDQRPQREKRHKSSS